MKRVSIIFPFTVLFAILIALENFNIAFSLISAMLTHELGHILAIKCFGGEILNNEIYGIGANISFILKDRSILYEVLIYLAGPILGIIAALFGKFLGMELFYRFSVSFSLVNIIPALPLDGGNILELILYSLNQEKTIDLISLVLGITIASLGTVIIFRHGNFSLFVLGICIITTIISKTTLQ